MKTRKHVALLLSLLAVVSLFGCAKQQETQQPANAAASAPATAGTTAAPEAPAAPAGPEAPAEITVTDMIGREVTVVPGSYQRVVCVGAGALRMYTYVCDLSLLCGVEDIDNVTLTERPKMFDSVARPYVLANKEAFAALPSCGVGGPNAQTAEAEKILSCEPDIVISEYEDVEKADALQEQLGVPVITLKSGAKGVFDDSFRGCLTLLGKIFCREERAEELVSYIAAQQEAVSARTKGVPEVEKPAVYVCGLGNWGTTNHLMTSESYVSFAVANVKNAVSGTGNQKVFALEKEAFVALGESMDMVVMDAAAVKNIKPLYAEDPDLFAGCKAFENGEVYLQMAFNAYYTNYEIQLANTWFIAKTVYPELFADVDLTAKTDEITEAFNGRALAEEIFACPASFGGYQKIDTATFFN